MRPAPEKNMVLFVKSEAQKHGSQPKGVTQTDCHCLCFFFRNTSYHSDFAPSRRLDSCEWLKFAGVHGKRLTSRQTKQLYVSSVWTVLLSSQRNSTSVRRRNSKIVLKHQLLLWWPQPRTADSHWTLLRCSQPSLSVLALRYGNATFCGLRS